MNAPQDAAAQDSAAPYGLRRPTAAPLPLVVSIPHTGTWMPESVRAALASPAMHAQPMTDWHLHRLYEFLPALGATTIFATVSRFVMDLNRPPRPRPLYPGRFETGLVPLETFHGEPVFAAPPEAGEVEARRLAWHAPYHAQLAALLEETRTRFGRVVLLDAHSVASVPNRLHGALDDEIYLGDRDGRSCGRWLRDLLQGAFAAEGFRVALNAPYKGGYITDHYGAEPGVEALQIEMAQRVYMDEDDPAGGPDHPRFAAAQQRLLRVFGVLAAAIS
ncbi:N-formylglutamate amidohydrolase [Wenzhouxiangella sp. XN24]|uniref:N-formylglutamate amidohydrolase n=1 Tax=Wenzhouxiangella sp. XN24 TaxID=2713569 RepID=UPI0013EC5410|nr:N-formylglutamate deformylase [Wenzhouxiangella sp. XN24]